MLDTFIVRQQSAYPQTVTVTEKRAPTDQSVALLMEMQDRARKTLIESVVVTDNLFSFAYSVFDSFPSGERILHVKFRVNGTDHVIQHVIADPIVDSRSEACNVIAGAMVKDMVAQIARKLLR